MIEPLARALFDLIETSKRHHLADAAQTTCVERTVRVLAVNALSILSAANVPLSNLSFENIQVGGDQVGGHQVGGDMISCREATHECLVDLSRTLCDRGDFTGSDLSGANLRALSFNHACLRRCKTTGTRLGQFPTLRGHTRGVTSVCGRTASEADCTLALWTRPFA